MNDATIKAQISLTRLIYLCWRSKCYKYYFQISLGSRSAPAVEILDGELNTSTEPSVPIKGTHLWRESLCQKLLLNKYIRDKFLCVDQYQTVSRYSSERTI